MDATGTVPDGGLRHDDLADLLARPGPFLTVYLQTDGSIDNAGQRSARGWKALRQELADAGAPDRALDLVEPLVAEAHKRGATLAVVADADELLLVEHLDEPFDHDRGSWHRLPDLVPLLRWRQDHVPFVLALADRGGADLLAQCPEREEITEQAGGGEPMRKVHPGGWSQARYQQRAENDWSGTAAEVADQIEELARTVDARLVVVGGDVRAVQLIADALPGHLAERTHRIDHGRAQDGSEDAREEEVTRLVATAVAEQTVALLRKFKEELGQQDQAVEGREATVDALNRAAVDVLLVADDRDQRAWVGAESVPLGTDDPATTGDPDPQEAVLADALVRGAIATGASIRVIPEAGPVGGGVGALLRWADPAP